MSSNLFPNIHTVLLSDAKQLKWEADRDRWIHGGKHKRSFKKNRGQAKPGKHISKGAKSNNFKGKKKGKRT